MDKKLFVVAVIPAFNEERTIGKVVLLARRYVDRVVVCDDGSTDMTAEVAEKLGASVVKHPKNIGKGAALKTALEYLKQLNPDVVVTLDGDGQHNPDEIPRLLEPINEGKADLVVGSRYVVGSKTDAPFYRRLGLKLVNSVSGKSGKGVVGDTQSGFMAYSAKVLDLMQQCEAEGYGVETEQLAVAVKNGLRVMEVPITVRTPAMKLVVMIPAYDEERAISSVIRRIPRSCCDEVEVLVIDDGSSDRTVEEAKNAGADKIVSFNGNRGLAVAFRQGLETALKMGADIIVNVDADGQYNPSEIPKLIEPIVNGKVDIVLGSRFKGWIESMPTQKRIANKLATFVTRHMSGLPISDAQTGFRAFTREAALRLNVMSDYTYVHETLMQAANYGLAVEEVPIEFRKRSGNSHLISNIFSYAKKAGGTMIRTYRDYQPLKTFLYLGAFIMLIGVITGFKVLVHFFETGMVGPYLPSAVLTILLVIVGFQTIVFGLLADMFKVHKRIQDEILYKLKIIENEKKKN